MNRGKALFVPCPALNTRSLSLLEAMTRAPTRCLPRAGSPLIRQQRERDHFPSLPSCSSLRRGVSVCHSQWIWRPWSCIPTDCGGGPTLDLRPQGQVQARGSALGRACGLGRAEEKVQILAPSLTSPVTWARCSTFLASVSSPGSHHRLTHR